MRNPILYLVGIFFFLGCEKENTVAPHSGTYTLDLNNVVDDEGTVTRTGTFIVSHNALAVFPINLTSKTRVISALGPQTIYEAQAKTMCSGAGRTELTNDHHIVVNINGFGPPASTHAADLVKITLEMPYEESPCSSPPYLRIPGPFCYGIHVQNKGWVWHFNYINPVLDNNAKKGYAEIEVNEPGVTAVGILFERSTNIDKISYTVH